MFKTLSILTAVFVVFAALSATATAHSVTMNLQFKITDKSDAIHVNGTSYQGQSINAVFPSLAKKYISSERNGTVVSAVSSGPNFLNILLDSTYPNDYLFSSMQNDIDNEFRIVFTEGNWTTIESKSSGVGSNYANIAVAAQKIFLRLQYDNIDISKSLRWVGPRQVVVKNTGRDASGIPKILIDIK